MNSWNEEEIRGIEGEDNQKKMRDFLSFDTPRQNARAYRTLLQSQTDLTDRFNATEYDFRFGLFAVFLLSALAFAFDNTVLVVGVYLGGAAFFLARPIWRRLFK
jgi:hypothetical protein